MKLNQQDTSMKYLLVSFLLVMFLSCKNDENKNATHFEQQKALIASSPYKKLHWRLIGPDQTSGRSTDVWGITGDTNIIYAAFATGGLWKTEDAGNTWMSLFDKEATLSIGNIAIAPSDQNIVYVGTGEANIFRASLPGVGMYKTMNGGKSFQHIGLEKSGSIARIVVHPTNANIVYAAASGNEWTYNEDRGLYKSEDGGKSWKKILDENEKSGCIDLIMDPSDPNTLYASMWNRIRKRWSDPMPEDGDHVYKSTDAGATWKIIQNGLPDTKHTGRIGLAISQSNPDVLYAFVDDHNIKRQPNKDETDSYERKVQKVVIGGAIYRSSDKGESWTKQAEIHDFFKPFSGTYGWVFSQIRVDPKDENEVYALGVAMAKSVDAGKTWSKFEPIDTTQNIHGDNHGMWFDKNNPDRMLIANDGGVSITYNGGIKWKNFFNKIPTTQFYTISYDMETPFNVYGSVQDEGTMSANVMNTFGEKRDTNIRNWKFTPGGEGTQIRVDPKNSNIVFSSSFYGRLMKSDLSKKEDKQSEHITLFDVGRIDSLRAEWLAATMISKHDNNVVYHGLQHLYKSADQGKTWKMISADLSYNDTSKMGVYPYLIYHQAITSLAEGDKPGIVYAGTDDGRVWLTKNDGASWIEITKGLPTNKHVITITTSVFNPSKVYIVLNDRRQDNNAPYIFVSENFGQEWKPIQGNLPQSPVNVLIEDVDKDGRLYCGTDMGVYVSDDQGVKWKSLTGDLPWAVSINDMFMHPRDKKLVIATYGRGVYVLEGTL